MVSHSSGRSNRTQISPVGTLKDFEHHTWSSCCHVKAMEILSMKMTGGRLFLAAAACHLGAFFCLLRRCVNLLFYCSTCQGCPQCAFHQHGSSCPAVPTGLGYSFELQGNCWYPASSGVPCASSSQRHRWTQPCCAEDSGACSRSSCELV